MSTKSTQLAKLTRNELLADKIQSVLRDSAVVWPMLMDMSDRFPVGVKSAVIPGSKARTVGDTPSSGTELADGTTEFVTDTLTLDQFKTVHDYVYDVDQQHSAVDLKDEFYAEAPKDLADYIEAAAVAKLIADAANHKQLPGTSNDEINLDFIGEIGQEMTEAKLPKQGRKLILSPRLARILRSEDSIRNASAFGNANSAQNGFIARAEGFDIYESNNLGGAEALAIVEGCAAKAVAKEVEIDEQRQSAKKRVFVSCDAAYGMKALRQGTMIWKLNSSATP